MATAGIAEFSAGVVSIVYVQNSTTIARCTVPGGVVTTVATFTNLGTLSHITLDLTRSRWDFFLRTASQFRARSGNLVGFCDATWLTSPCLTGTTSCAGACSGNAGDANCGACGVPCSPGTFCGGSRTCASSCSSGQTFCTDQCVDVATDPAHCGSCATACGASQVCVAGTCTCPTGTTNCGGTCVNLQSDNSNCSACGTICGGVFRQQSCQMGVCACTNTGQSMCGTNCVSLQSDANNCGSCGHVCATGEVCSMGSCAACPAGSTNCSGVCANLTSDADPLRHVHDSLPDGRGLQRGRLHVSERYDAVQRDSARHGLRRHEHGFGELRGVQHRVRGRSELRGRRVRMSERATVLRRDVCRHRDERDELRRVWQRVRERRDVQRWIVCVPARPDRVWRDMHRSADRQPQLWIVRAFVPGGRSLQQRRMQLETQRSALAFALVGPYRTSADRARYAGRSWVVRAGVWRGVRRTARGSLRRRRTRRTPDRTPLSRASTRFGVIASFAFEYGMSITWGVAEL